MWWLYCVLFSRLIMKRKIIIFIVLLVIGLTFGIIETIGEQINLIASIFLMGAWIFILSVIVFNSDL